MITDSDCDEILSFWFKSDNDKLYKEFWFDKSADNIVSEKYSDILYKLESFLTEQSDFSKWSSKILITLIIIFDQFSRMIYRNKTEKLTQIHNNDKIALLISKFIFDSNKDMLFSIEQRVFLLMPFRHTKTRKYLDFVLRKIKEYYSEDKQYVIFLDRFRLATYASYTKLTEESLLFEYSDKEDDKEDFDYESLLDFSYSLNNPKYNPKILYDVLLDFVTSNSIDNIGVSLSGGVDSMVILFLLNKLKIEGKINKLYAMHIEYCNRIESPIETKFLGLYCNSLSDVPLFVRKVDYMKRDQVDRVFYEEETKKIRFNTYSFLSKKYNIKGWCLGHHNGDIVENVLMNIFNGRDILDLGVMKEISYVQSYNTYLYRPFINNSKQQIYQMAKLFNIPYFKDTTPDWSGRGILRRKVLPNIELQWPFANEKIISISNQSEEWNDYIQNAIFKPIKNSILFDENQITFPINENTKNMPRVLWLNLFLHIFHSKGKNMISNKNLDYFMKTLDRNIKKENKFMFSNKSIGIFKTDKLIIIL